MISTGIEVMFAFLLIVPFNTGFEHVSQFERTDYFVTLLLIAVAAMLLMAPSVHHRLLFDTTKAVVIGWQTGSRSPRWGSSRSG